MHHSELGDRLFEESLLEAVPHTTPSSTSRSSSASGAPSWRVIDLLHLPLDAQLRVYGIHAAGRWRPQLRPLPQVAAPRPPAEDPSPDVYRVYAEGGIRRVGITAATVSLPRERSPHRVPQAHRAAAAARPTPSRRPPLLETEGTVLTLMLAPQDVPAGRGDILIEALVVTIMEAPRGIPTVTTLTHSTATSTLGTSLSATTLFTPANDPRNTPSL